MPHRHRQQAALTLEVLQQFRVIFGSLRQYFREVEERCGITGAQTWALQEIEREPGVGVSLLAARMGIHQSTCSQLVEGLTGLGLVEKRRDPNDQRRLGLYIGAAGSAVLDRLPGPAEGLLPEALASLPEVVLKTLNINLYELTRRLPGQSSQQSAEFAGTPLAELLQGESRKPV
jgi:DNA-binding MarR family transcriptional regulator